MERILFGDNQFFGVNHMSEDRAREQAIRFSTTQSIVDVLEYVNGIGINTFMCTTHDRISEICDHVRTNPESFQGFQFYPCLPYGHKYNNAIAEQGVLGAMRTFLPGTLINTVARGGAALASKNYVGLMKLLVDAELQMFEGLRMGVVFLQNVATDLLLGMGAFDFFSAFSEYVQEKYGAEAGFITMNFPKLLPVLEDLGMSNPIICTSFNKAGFRMPGGIQEYERIAAEKRCRLIAMQALAAGALRPKEAMDYVCNTPGIDSILFGASTRSHILETKELIESYSSGAGNG